MPDLPHKLELNGNKIKYKLGKTHKMIEKSWKYTKDIINIITIYSKMHGSITFGHILWLKLMLTYFN